MGWWLKWDLRSREVLFCSLHVYTVIENNPGERGIVR